MSTTKILESDGVETLYMHGATVSTLTPLLNPQVPWVWILGHVPNRYVDWWQTSLPINNVGSPVTAEFRLIGYDLLLPTSRFLELAVEFEDHGLVLIQSHQRMPSTLDLSRIPDNQLANVLRSNGAFLRMYLPHAVETAQVQCFEKGYLARVTTLSESLKTNA